MIVSWDWLKEYVTLDMPLSQLTDRLTMAGFNLEEVKQADGDLGIDLEITSNRPDCLGHLGVAREISVLFGGALKTPDPKPKSAGPASTSLVSVAIECPDLCPQYVARVIRGVKIKSSPAWLQKRLATLGISSINNVVDITNYVLMECGQPLHAFDYDKLRGKKIIVRRARQGEKIVAIDQREYPLDPAMCVIADAEHPVAIGGVMGGLETEIGDKTANVLIEAASFAPLSIRNTARSLKLHSDSSYRFERGVDPEQLDWASRRCCELILDLAGGELCADSVVAGAPASGARSPITLRLSQIRRTLGIDVPGGEAFNILNRLGVASVGTPTASEAQFQPPSWRADLTREIDLVEEVARIHGYDKIPHDVAVPLELSSKSLRDRVIDVVCDVLTGAGCYEAVTLSFVSEDQWALFAPRGERAPLRVEHSSRRHENILRQSLVPSLLVCRRENERQGNFHAELFEIARVFLDAKPGQRESEVEPTTISLVSGRSFADLKGYLDAIAWGVNHAARVTVEACDAAHFVPGRGARVLIDGQPWGWMGELERSLTDKLDLRDAVTVFEVDLAMLESVADLVPHAAPLPLFPAVERDLNFVLDEPVTWAELELVVRQAAGPLLETVGFGGQYRGKQIAADKKSYVVTLSYRAADRTLTSDEIDRAQQAVIAACEEKLQAALR